MLKIKILIVDDEEDYCMLMKNYFEHNNYEVFTAFTLQDGFRSLKENAPDILFLDNNLPDGEGWQHTKTILKNHPDLKVNLISAYSPKTDDFISHPNVKIWEKPISMTSLNELFKVA